MKDECVIQIKNLSKEYRLGVIGSGTLRRDLQSWYARRRGKDDPNLRIGAKAYDKGDTLLALDNINLTVNRGERLGIIGANGAGKSTLLKLLSRITSPTGGSFSFRGRIAGMLEVGTGFNPELTGRENIYLNGAILGMSKAEISEKIVDIIAFSECEKFIDTPVKRYSSGMFVKLAFAVAAHLDAEIIIMDEVLAVGDVQFQRKCIEKMRRLALDQNRTILYVSHNMSTIRSLCTRCIVLSHGKLIFDGDTEEAIRLYLGQEQDDFVTHNYTKGDCRREPVDSQDICIKSASYIGKTDNIFNASQPLELELAWTASADVVNLCLRVEVADNRRNPITAYVIEDFCQVGKSQTVKHKFSIDISHLAAGGYYTRYVFYNRKDEQHPYQTLENVAGLSFRVRRPQDNNMPWQKSWGSVHMPQIKLLS